MADLHTYRIDLGWSATRLARKAGIQPSLIKSAEKGEVIHRIIAEMIAEALSRAYGREIKPTDIEGLKFS